MICIASRNDDCRYAELAITGRLRSFLIENIAFFLLYFIIQKRLDSCGGMYGLKKIIENTIVPMNFSVEEKTLAMIRLSDVKDIYQINYTVLELVLREA